MTKPPVIAVDVVGCDEGAVCLDDNDAALVDGAHGCALELTKFPKKGVQGLPAQHAAIIVPLTELQCQVDQDLADSSLRHSLTDVSRPGHDSLRAGYAHMAVSAASRKATF